MNFVNAFWVIFFIIIFFFFFAKHTLIQFATKYIVV